MWPVSPKVNSPKNDSPDLLEAIGNARLGPFNQRSLSSGDTITGIRSCSLATRLFASVVMIVKVRIHSPLSGSFQ